MKPQMNYLPVVSVLDEVDVDGRVISSAVAGASSLRFLPAVAKNKEKCASNIAASTGSKIVNPYIE